MNSNSQSVDFVFLSQILDLPVLNQSNAKLGKLTELTATTKDIYPKVNKLVVSKNGKKLIFSWEDVEKFNLTSILLKNNVVEINSSSQNNEEIFVKETFLDKQIVDTFGSKLVRVNDVHLLKEKSNLWVAHIDIGFRGLLRRLGYEKFFIPIIKWIFAYELPDKFISWKYVQPLFPAGQTSASLCDLKLKVSHQKLAELHPADLADIILDMGTNERTAMFCSLDNVTASRMIKELPHKMRMSLLETLEKDQLIGILAEMPVDECVDLLSDLPRKIVPSILSSMKKEKADEIRTLLKHSSKTAGGLMNTSFIAIPSILTVEQTIAKYKEITKAENLYSMYVIDENGALVGITYLGDILKAEPTKPITEVMKKRVIKARINTNQRLLAQTFLKYDLNIMPVVDRNNKLKGIVAFKDVLKAVFPRLPEEL